MPFVSCPGCGRPVTPPPELGGVLYACPHCRAEFRVEESRARSSRRKPRSFPWQVLFGGITALTSVVALCVFVARSRPPVEPRQPEPAIPPVSVAGEKRPT